MMTPLRCLTAGFSMAILAVLCPAAPAADAPKWQPPPPIAEPAVTLVPRPKMVVWERDTFVLTARTPVYYSSDAAKAEAEALAAKLRTATGLPVQALPVSARERGQIGAIVLDLEPSFEAHGGKEGYMMSVGGGGVRIGAGTATGLANGGKILLQLLPAAGSANPKAGAMRWTMPCGKFADLPGMPDEVKSLKRE